MKEMARRETREPFTVHPDIEAYVEVRDDWIRQKILSYKKKERKWAVELHSTEQEGEPEDPRWGPQIYFSVYSHNRNAKMKKLIDEGFREVYENLFPRNGFGWDKAIQVYPSLVTIDLHNYPRYCKVAKGKKMVRSFLDYLTEMY